VFDVPRMARVKSNTGVYHLIWRGANRQEIFHDDTEYLKKVKKIAAKTLDITEFLAQEGLLGELQKVDKVVTYHESCHLGRGLKVRKQPRDLMQSIPGIQIKELKDPGRCCGAAGSFSLSHYDLSMKINKHKTDDIVNSGAETLVTGCAACMMHIKDGLSQNNNGRINVMHTAELLAEAYSKDDK